MQKRKILLTSALYAYGMRMTGPTQNARLQRKPSHRRAVRVNLTLPPTIYNKGEEVLAKFGFTGFSDYLQARIRKDSGMELQP